MAQNNIAFLRRQRNLTQANLAKLVGMQVSTLNRIENGITKKFDKYRDDIAKALKVKPDELDWDSGDVISYPIVGIIRHKTFIQKLTAKKVETVPEIGDLPETTEVVKIMTADLPHYHRRNELLYYDAIAQTNEKLFLDRECIVQLDDVKRGEWLLAWVSKANARGRYHLHIPNAPIMTDQKIKGAHPILFIKRS